MHFNETYKEPHMAVPVGHDGKLTCISNLLLQNLKEEKATVLAK